MGLTRTDLRARAAAAGISPHKSLGQNFLVDQNLARAIVADAKVEPGDHVLEIGAGFGSLTLPLADVGASVLAVEFDRKLVQALGSLEPTQGSIEVLAADATKIDWPRTLGESRWLMVSNLPYNIATTLLLQMLQDGLPVDRYVVMVQKEVGERLVAKAGEHGYGAPSVRVAYHAAARIIRPVPPDVFWPEPTVASVIVELVPHDPPVPGDAAAIFALVRESFAQRRKTMRSAVRRLGLSRDAADAALDRAGLDPSLRPGVLSLEDFARLAAEVQAS